MSDREGVRALLKGLALKPALPLSEQGRLSLKLGYRCSGNEARVNIDPTPLSAFD